MAYLNILKANKANIYTINGDGDDIEIADIQKQLKRITDKIDDVYIANEDELKQCAKAICKTDSKLKYPVVFKSLRKKLSAIAKYWVKTQKVNCYDSDYILDWTLEKCVFTDSDVKQSEYQFDIQYRPGAKMQVPDALSRRRHENVKPSQIF